ncbi:MAG: thioesterase family protein [Acidimicrobiia bacterium]|nr:thioesterase family protein [Acidimicrobiia bacterium]
MMRSDVDFLGLVPDEAPGRFGFSVVDRLARLDGRLYGGAAIAISVAVAEITTARSPLWMTTQFVATAPLGTEMVAHAEVLAGGKRTNQVRVTGTGPGGDVVFASLGATGHHRAGGITGEYENGPVVTPPAESQVWASPFDGIARAAGYSEDVIPALPATGFAAAVEMRGPEIIQHPDPGAGRMCIWARMRDSDVVTPAMAAFLADMVPMSIAVAVGAIVGGTSLDNTIRMGAFVDTEWVLLDLRPHLAVGDYGHGVAHVWSEDGRLLATASQTASLFRFDTDHLPGTSDVG